MTIAATLEKYLDGKGVDYEVLTHRHTEDSLHTAEAAHVTGDKLAKAIVLKDEDGYLVAVIPATFKLKMGLVHQFTGRNHLAVAEEHALERLFKDCEFGAVPAVAAAYGLEAVWDETLAYAETVYFEGGDHASLFKISGSDFKKLMGEDRQAFLGEHIQPGAALDPHLR
jgi:Ala-tRNA(Pro) deacylase